MIGNITATITRDNNNAGESALGDIIADAQLVATRSAGTGNAVAAFMNPGDIRATCHSRPRAKWMALLPTATPLPCSLLATRWVTLDPDRCATVCAAGAAMGRRAPVPAGPSGIEWLHLRTYFPAAAQPHLDQTEGAQFIDSVRGKSYVGAAARRDRRGAGLPVH